jgi:hypothetical protein
VGAFTDPAAAQDRGNFRMVDDDQDYAGPAIGHLGFDAIDDHPVASLRRAILPFDFFVGR